MVIFCVKDAGRPVTFRGAAPADLLRSGMRQNFLVPRHEVFADRDFTAGGEAAVLRRNDTSALEKWHGKSALGHWEVMRFVLPDFVWESW